jgi:hypothetical protein
MHPHRRGTKTSADEISTALRAAPDGRRLTRYPDGTYSFRMSKRLRRKRFSYSSSGGALLDVQSLRGNLLSWKAPNQPHIYTHFRFDATHVQAWLAEKRKTLPRLSLVHFIVKVCAKVFEEHPDLNVSIRKGRHELRPHVHVSITVAKADAQGVPITRIVQLQNVDKKPLHDVVRETVRKLVRLEESANRPHPMLFKVPLPLWRPILRWFAWRDVSLWNPSREFSSVIVTDLGAFLSEASDTLVDFSSFGPLSEISPVYWLVGLGAIKPRPCVVDGAVVVRPCLDLWNTFDHRFFTGEKAGRLAHVLDKYFSTPSLLEPDRRASPGCETGEQRLTS